MQPYKSSTYLCFVIVAATLLLSPCPSYSFASLDIFYSNDVGGHTEPCG